MRRIVLACVLAVLPRLAKADHAPGHGASEAVRSLNSLGGGTGAAVSRILILQEASTSRRSTITPHSAYVTSILGEYSPHRWFSFGLQVPLQVIDEREAPAVVGLGNVRATTRVTLHADKLFHRIVTFGTNATFPTRTVRFTTDPGATWVVSPYGMFTRNYHRAFWQILATAPIEVRPAGTAIDLGVGAQGGYRFWGKLAPSAGLLANVRIATWCRRVEGGAEFCAPGRVTEIERQVGATALYVTGGLSWNFARWGALAASIQVPVTPVRDFDVGGSIGLQAFFPSKRAR